VVYVYRCLIYRERFIVAQQAILSKKIDFNQKAVFDVTSETTF